MRILLLFCVLPLFYAVQAQEGRRPDPREQHKTDSIRHIYVKAESDTARLKALVDLTDAYDDQNDFKNLSFYNDLKGKLFQKLKASPDLLTANVGREGEASYYFILGSIAKDQGNSRQALSYFLRSLDLYKTIGNELEEAILLSHVASTYSMMGNYSESLLYCFRSLKKKEKLGDQGQVAAELNNIGAIYSDVHAYTKALIYLNRAKNISEKQHDKESTALYTGNIGHCYQLLCDSAFEAGNASLSLELQNKALDYYFSALKMSEEAGDRDNASICLENIGIIYSNVYEYKKALPYLLKAFDIYQELGLRAEQSYCLVMLGAAYRGLGQTQKAEESYEQAIELASQTRSNYYMMEANLGNSEFYEKTKRPAKALKYYRDYVANKDSIFNNEKTKALARTELNYEFEKKEAAIKFENGKMVYRLEAVNKQNRQWQLFFIVLIVLVLTVLFFVKRAYDNKKKLALLLAAEDQRKDVLLQEVHHRINNNLQIISSLLTLQANNAEDEKLSEYLMQSQNRIQSLSAMHELLYDTNSPLHIDMKEYLSKMLDFHRDVAASMPMPVRISEHVEAVKFPTKLAVPVALIINELVTNSLKYAFTGRAEGQVHVSLAKQGEHQWQVTVSDNGKGLPAEGGGRKDSLGLKLVNIMTRQIKGKFSSENREGAHFSVVFELANKK
jgi:two-component sensor histidine kinase